MYGARVRAEGSLIPVSKKSGKSFPTAARMTPSAKIAGGALSSCLPGPGPQGKGQRPDKDYATQHTTTQHNTTQHKKTQDKRR